MKVDEIEGFFVPRTFSVLLQLSEQERSKGDSDRLQRQLAEAREKLRDVEAVAQQKQEVISTFRVSPFYFLASVNFWMIFKGD